MADPQRPYGDEERRVLSLAAHRLARAEIGSWPGYAPTPLVNLDALAKTIGVALVAYKDEGERFGLGRRKALRGAHAGPGALSEHAAQASHARTDGGRPARP
ncbi:hypothetical protein WDZ92_40075, partial [Nostoc sp. NIES-2111]